MITVNLKINQEYFQSFNIDETDKEDIFAYLTEKQARRYERLKIIYEDIRKKLISENPDLTDIQIEQELSYILNEHDFHTLDIADFLDISRTAVYYNIKTIRNELWAENNLSISKKTMSERIELLKNYAEYIKI
jgi:predicted DNA-binding protein YlxM (UPF0122 family)